jgi:hypothetical protein
MANRDGWPKKVQDRDGGARDANNSVLMLDRNDADVTKPLLASDFNSRSIRAKLHRGVLNFFAACAKSNSSDNGGENDCALHRSSP